MIPLYKLQEPELAQALKEVLPLERRRERITDRALAERAEVGLERIRAVEKGIRTPSMGLFVVLAWALDLDPRDLLDRVLNRMNLPHGSRPVLTHRAQADIGESLDSRRV